MSKRNPMPEGRRREVLDRDNWTCQANTYGWPTDTRCNGPVIIHHKLLRGMGGTSDPLIHDADNLVTLCGGLTGRDGHHGEVHDRPRDAYVVGLLRRHTT